MHPPVSLYLAATPAVMHIEGQAARPMAMRDAALLAWLALEGPTPRTRLAQLLWPETDGDAARNSLRQRLFQLKRLLGQELVSGSTVLALAPGVAHDLADADTVLGDEPPSIGDAYDAWLLEQRARRRVRMRDSLAELSEMAEAALDYRDALTHTCELLALEPLSEDAHRRVMRLHYLSGDRAAALAAFDRCEQVLKDELGTRPSAETLALLVTIDGSAAVPARASRVMPASVLRPPRLIGRDPELTQLVQGWEAGEVVALVGDAGLGKTRLLQEFAAAREGVVHVAGRPGDAGVPFATLARLLRAVIGLTPAVLASLEPATRAEMARVLPEMDTGLPQATGEGQRLALQRALQRLLQTHARLTGALVDDLHFADAASLDMLLALIDGDAPDNPPGSSPQRALRWVIAFRPAEAGSPVQALHDALVEQARLRLVPLRPLDEAGIATLVDDLGLPGVSGTALARGLHQRTGGNPLFVLETLKQAWVERTLDRLADAANLPRPQAVGRLIERRIAQLSPGALALARVASIATVDFDIALAERVLDATAMQFVDSINELEAAQVLRGNAFAHDLVFEAVRSSVPATIAAHLHAQVAAWLEQHGGEPARIAQHWIDAQQAPRSLPWLQQSADAARRALRAKEFIAFMERKSAIEEAAGRGAEAFKSQLAAADEFVNTDLDEARSMLHCDRLERLAATPAQRIEALLHRCEATMHQARFPAAEALAREALRASLALGDAALTVFSRRAISLACTLDNRFDDGLRQLEGCVAWIDEHGSIEERSQFHGDLAALCDNLGRLDDALPHHGLAFELSKQCGNLSNASVARSNYACNRIDAGDLHAADAALCDALQLLAHYDGVGAQVGTAQTVRALCLAHLGRYAEALSQAELSVESMRLYQPGRVVHASLRLATCWWHLGQWSRLSQVLGAVTIDAQSGLAPTVSHARLQWACAIGLRSDAGVVARARDALAAVVETIAPADRPDLRLPMLIDLAAAGPPAEAMARLAELRLQAERQGHRGTVLAAWVRLAGVAADIDADLACHAADAALTLAATCQSTGLLPAELWLHCARAFLSAGDSVRAAAVSATGRAWLQMAAQDHVPAAFRDSFLHRNPANRDLLALADRLARIDN